MKKIYWSAIAFSTGIAISDIIISQVFNHPISFETSFKAILFIFVFAFINRHHEVEKQKLIEAQEISEQLAREIQKLDANKRFNSDKEMEKEFNFFSKTK